MNQQVRLYAPFEDIAAFSADDFVAMMDAGAFANIRVELVGGGLEKVAPAQTRHSRMNVKIAALLYALFEPLRGDVGSDLAVAVDNATIRGIDVAVGLRPFSEGIVPAAEILLAVEIADSTLARDLGVKAVDYARGGIAHYWVVDLNAEAVHVMGQASANGYLIRSVVRFGEPLAVPSTSETITL